jgi:hypothetical protein
MGERHRTVGNGGEGDDDLRPYLELAREIKREVEALAAEVDVDGDRLDELISAVPQRERAKVLQAVFDRLDPERQWEIVERVFGDAEITTFLAEERAHRLATIERTTAIRSVVRAARAQQRLDVRDVPAGRRLELGLFRPSDVRAGISRGRRSDTCARLIVARTTADPGVVRVLDDVFNPRGGLFVTGDYDEAVWRRDVLASHAAVRFGSIVDEAGQQVLEPVLYPGARLDAAAGDEPVTGRLPLGFVVLDDEDLFADVPPLG